MTVHPELLQVMWQILRLSQSGFYGEVRITLREGRANIVHTTDSKLAGALPRPPEWFARLFVAEDPGVPTVTNSGP